MRLPSSTAIRAQAAVCAGGALVRVRRGAEGRRDRRPGDETRARLDHLRALQRKGREMLAATAPHELPSFSRTDPGSRDVR